MITGEMQTVLQSGLIKNRFQDTSGCPATALGLFYTTKIACL